MQKKFKYAQLIKVNNDKWYNNNGLEMTHLENLNFIEVLNAVGKNGWQVISMNERETVIVLMKEYYIGG